MEDSRLARSFWALRITFATVPFLAGLDKFFNLLTDWPHYLSPFVSRMLPMPAHSFMLVVGVIEMIVGIGVLTRHVRLFAYVATAWLVLIAFNLVLGGFLDIAVRDLAMAASAFSLAQRASMRAQDSSRQPQQQQSPVPAA